MNTEELQRLSKAELIEMVLHQRAQMQKLQTTLTELENRLVEMEAQRDYFASSMKSLRPREEVAEHAVIEQRMEREQATRDALRHLDDVDYLARSSLAELLAKAHGVWPEGSHLQQELYRAIEAMRPVAGQSREPQQQRRYDILRQTYLEKKKAVEVANALTISERQYYRDLKAAIQTVADQILSK